MTAIIKEHLTAFIFLATAVAVSVFIVVTAPSLPETVASHFNAQGQANGHMSKMFYTGFMLVFAVGIPLLVIGSALVVSRFPDQKINLPNKQVWLSEKYRKTTFAYLRGHAFVMGTLTSGFMGYIHWLVVRANAAVPATISSQEILMSVGGFGAAILLMTVLLPLRFMRLPKE